MEHKCDKCGHILKIRRLWRGRQVAVCKNCGFRINNFQPKTNESPVKSTKPVVRQPKTTESPVKAKSVEVVQPKKLATPIKAKNREMVIARRKKLRENLEKRRRKKNV